MNSIRYVQKPAEQDPAKLLFEVLAKKCKSKTARESAIVKVISSKGGDKTVADTIKIANQQADSLLFSVEVLKDEKDELSNDDFEWTTYDFDGDFYRRGGRGEEVEKRYDEAKARHDLYKNTITSELQTALDKYEIDNDLSQVVELSKKFG